MAAVPQDYKGIWQHGLDELDLGFFELVMGNL